MKLHILGKKINLPLSVLICAGLFVLVGLGVYGYVLASQDVRIIKASDDNGSEADQSENTENLTDTVTVTDTDMDSQKQLSEDIAGQPAAAAPTTPTLSPVPIETIQVYVVGCVKNPGTIVTLEKGAIIADAVSLAGGFSEQADAENVNMVYRLYDNTTIKILDKQSEKDQAHAAGSSVVLSTSSQAGNSAVILISSGQAGSSQSASGSAGSGQEQLSGQILSQQSTSKININTADKSELMKLSGIGEKTAQAIIDYRNANGSFKSIQDIIHVKNIGNKTFENLKDMITITDTN